MPPFENPDGEVPSPFTMKVAHIITGLDPGGAERMLVRVAERLEGPGLHQSVLSFRSGGTLEPAVRRIGIPVNSLGLKKGPGDLVRLPRLWAWLRAGRFDLVQTWLPDPNVVGGLAAWMLRIPMVWGLHQANLSPELNGPRTLRMIRWGARLSSRVPRGIVCVGEAVRRAHVNAGFASERMRVIPLGFDLEVFRPRPMVRAEARQAWGVTGDASVIGLVARYDPHKDIPTFLEAARLLKGHRPDARFVLCGAGMEASNRELAMQISRRGLKEAVILLGPQEEVQRVIPGFDLATLSSVGEGFPSVLGEAMACGVPCVATDVGDVPSLLGDTGTTVPPCQPAALAEQWNVFLNLPAEEKQNRGLAARARIEKHFDIRDIAARYRDLYAEVAGPHQ